MPDTARVTVHLCAPAGRKYIQCRWPDPGTGRRVTRSTGTADEAAARRYAAEREYELNHGLLPASGRGTAPARLTWAEFRARYDAEKLSARRPATRARAGYVFGRFERESRVRLLRDADEACLSAHAARLAQAHTPASVQQHMAYLRAALRWAARQKLIPTAPAIEMPKVPRTRRVNTTDAAGYRRLLTACPSPAWRLLVGLAWYAGLRRGELLALTWDDPARPRVDLTAGRITLPAACNKADADQWVPVHPDLTAVLARVPRRDRTGQVCPVSRSANEVSRTFGAIARAAGLAGLKLHDLRRSFCSRYAPKVEAAVLQRLARHADIRTTLSYYADLSLALDDAIRQA